VRPVTSVLSSRIVTRREPLTLFSLPLSWLSLLLVVSTVATVGHSQSADPMSDVIRSSEFEALRGETSEIESSLEETDTALPPGSNLRILFYEHGQVSDLIAWLGPRPFKNITQRERDFTRSKQLLHSWLTYQVADGSFLRLDVAVPHPKSVTALNFGLSSEFNSIVDLSSDKITKRSELILSGRAVQEIQLADGSCKLLTKVKPDGVVVVTLAPCQERGLLQNYFTALNFPRLELKLAS
jgi:hypothetical protein